MVALEAYCALPLARASGSPAACSGEADGGRTHGQGLAVLELCVLRRIDLKGVRLLGLVETDGCCWSSDQRCMAF